MASGIYNRFKANLMKKVVDLVNDTIKCALMTNSHTFTATNTLWSNVSANEVAATGNYVAGGATLGTQAVTEAATTYWSAANTTWATATITAYFAVLYDTTASNNLIACIDFGGAITSTGGTFQITWNGSGIITLA